MISQRPYLGGSYCPATSSSDKGYHYIILNNINNKQTMNYNKVSHYLPKPHEFTSLALQSGASSFMVKDGMIYITIHYGDIYDSMTSLFSDLNRIEWGSHSIHPLIKDTHDLYLGMQDLKLTLVKPVFDGYHYTIDFNFTAFTNNRHLSYLHNNLNNLHLMHKVI